MVGIVNKYEGKKNQIYQNDQFLLHLQQFIYEEKFDCGLRRLILIRIRSLQDTRKRCTCSMAHSACARIFIEEKIVRNRQRWPRYSNSKCSSPKDSSAHPSLGTRLCASSSLENKQR